VGASHPRKTKGRGCPIFRVLCERWGLPLTILFDPELQIGAAEYTYEGTHRYHGVAMIRVSPAGITHWREYQHISPLAWQEFVGVTKF